MSDDSAKNNCADIHYVELKAEAIAFTAQRITLVIFTRDGLPVGQQWLRAGESPSPLKDVPSDPPTPAPVDPARISVVICTRDRPAELRQCLASFANQTQRPGQIVVVDNASRTDETRQVVTAAGATYLREDRPGLDFARNAGARAATGEFVLYTDDDTELHEAWIANAVAAFGDDPQIVAVTGLVLPATLATESQLLFETQWGFGRGFFRIDFGPDFYKRTRNWGCPAWELGAGANMGFRREIFDKIGWFDERLDVGQSGCCGDSEYWYRILSNGYICRYEPTAVLKHYHRASLAGLENQIFQYMRGHIAALLVQYERTGDLGNLRRAFISIPLHYMKLIAARLIRGRRARKRMLRQQISGCFSGLLFYLRAPKPAPFNPQSKAS